MAVPRVPCKPAHMRPRAAAHSFSSFVVVAVAVVAVAAAVWAQFQTRTSDTEVLHITVSKGETLDVRVLQNRSQPARLTLADRGEWSLEAIERAMASSDGRLSDGTHRVSISSAPDFLNVAMAMLQNLREATGEETFDKVLAALASDSVRDEIMNPGQLWTRVADAARSRRSYLYHSTDLLPSLYTDAVRMLQMPTTRRLWVGSDGYRASPHFDQEPNVLVQLRGRKIVWIWPPSSLRALHLFPRAHPCSRQSMMATRSSSPLRRSFVAEGNPLEWPEVRRVSLNPGTAIYIPAFWPHSVLSEGAPEDGVVASLAHWFGNTSELRTISTVRDLADEALGAVPSDYAGNAVLMVHWLASYLRGVVEAEEGSEALLRGLLSERYDSLVPAARASSPVPPKTQNAIQRGCGKGKEFSSRQRQAYSMGQRVSEIFREGIQNRFIREVLIQDHADVLISTEFWPQATPMFLRSCFS